jgi:hypothetical protein
LEESFLTAQKFFLSSHAHQTTTEKRKRKEGQKTTEKRITSEMASFAEAPAGDVAKGTRIYIQDFF